MNRLSAFSRRPLRALNAFLAWLNTPTTESGEPIGAQEVTVDVTFDLLTGKWRVVHVLR